MSGLFGYFDPQHRLLPDCLERMQSVMAVPADTFSRAFVESDAAIGCTGKGIYPDEGEPITDEVTGRCALMIGRLLPAGEEDGSFDARRTIRQALRGEASADRLAALNGPFAAAVWDGPRRQLELLTDRYGMYPLYAARYGGAVLFASQIKALLEPGVLPVEPDPVAISLMLSIGELVDDMTLLRSIRLLPAATRAVYTASDERRDKYWHYAFDESATDYDATATRLGGSLRRAVARVCSGNASVGVPLSGGLDSRVLMAAAPDPSRVPSLTWGLAGCRDLRYAAAAARAAGSPHEAFVFDGDYLKTWGAAGVWLTEGQLPCTDFHVLPFVDDVAKRCDVILNGYAGDAVLGGNFINREWWQAASPDAAAAALWRWRDNVVGDRYRRSLADSASDAREAFVRSYLASPGESAMDRAMGFLLDNRVRRRTSGGTSLMRKEVESDQPFFDNDFFDDVSKVPYAWQFRHGLYLDMLRRCFPAMAGVAWQRTGMSAGAPRWMMYVSLGVHRLDRLRPFRPLFRSRRVSDFAGWMRGPLRSYIEDVLLDSRTLERGWVDADTTRRVVGDHVSAAADNGSLIGALLCLELFARLFVDRDEPLRDECRTQGPAMQVRRIAHGNGSRIES